jgi:hypothetical protein
MYVCIFNKKCQRASDDEMMTVLKLIFPPGRKQAAHVTLLQIQVKSAAKTTELQEPLDCHKKALRTSDVVAIHLCCVLFRIFNCNELMLHGQEVSA